MKFGLWNDQQGAGFRFRTVYKLVLTAKETSPELCGEFKRFVGRRNKNQPETSNFPRL